MKRDKEVLVAWSIVILSVIMLWIGIGFLINAIVETIK